MDCQHGLWFLCLLYRGTTHSVWASAARVDELDDGVRVVVEVRGERGDGERVAVLGDEVLEVGGNLLCVGRAHTSRGTTLRELVGEAGLSEGAGREKSCNDVGAHCD